RRRWEPGTARPPWRPGAVSSQERSVRRPEHLVRGCAEQAPRGDRVDAGTELVREPHRDVLAVAALRPVAGEVPKRDGWDRIDSTTGLLRRRAQERWPHHAHLLLDAELCLDVHLDGREDL